MADPLDLTPAREALATHAHDPREVCPTCCDDVCDPCVYALRDVVAEVERLTAALATAHAEGRRAGLEEIAKEMDADAAAFYSQAGAAHRYSEVTRVAVRARWLAEHGPIAAKVTP